MIWLDSMALPGLALRFTLTGTPVMKSDCEVWDQRYDCHVDTTYGPVICLALKYAWVVPNELREITITVRMISPESVDFIVF